MIVKVVNLVRRQPYRLLSRISLEYRCTNVQKCKKTLKTLKNVTKLKIKTFVNVEQKPLMSTMFNLMPNT